MDFKTLLDQITLLFQNLSMKQKIVAAVSVLFVVGFIVFLLIFRSKDTMVGSGYSILFEKTNASDSALIIQQLEQEGVPYKIVDEGTIAVPSEHVYKQRIAIAAQGIPKDSNVGFEIFDQSEFGATDFEQQIKYLRALEGELSRTIEALSPISKADVHIAIPKETVFAEKKTPATASVALNITPGLNLSIKQITGIKNLVSSSITNLLPDDVAIVNQDGVPLGDEDGSAYESELVKSQIRYKREFETNLEEKIINVLAPFIGGVDKVVAKVNIDFDFSRQESTNEVFDPDSVPRSEQSTEESREGVRPQDVGGVPGAVSNIGPVQGVENQNETETYEKSSTTTNYEISKKVTRVKGEFAKVERLSAAVVVDGNYQMATGEQGESTGELEFVPLSEAQIASIRDIVRQSVGFSAARGDEVTVSNFEFKPLQKDGTKPATQTFVDQLTYYTSPLIPITKYLFAALLLFVFYKKVIKPFSEKMLEQSVEEYSADEVKAAAEDDDEENAEDTLEKFRKARKRVEDQLGVGEEFNEEELKYDVLLEKMKNLADDKSEEVAGLLQTMIKNESDYDVHGNEKGNG